MKCEKNSAAAGKIRKEKCTMQNVERCCGMVVKCAMRKFAYVGHRMSVGWYSLFTWKGVYCTLLYDHIFVTTLVIVVLSIWSLSHRCDVNVVPSTSSCWRRFGRRPSIVPTTNIVDSTMLLSTSGLCSLPQHQLNMTCSKLCNSCSHVVWPVN